MGTPSFVGIKENNTYRMIYVHYDGYISYMGNLLLNHYDENKLRAALELGNANYLGETLNPLPKPKFSLFWPPKFQSTRGFSEFYHRDLNKLWEHNKPFETSAENDLFQYGHVYVMENGVWYYAGCDARTRNGTTFNKITKEFINKCKEDKDEEDD